MVPCRKSKYGCSPGAAGHVRVAQDHVEVRALEFLLTAPLSGPVNVSAPAPSPRNRPESRKSLRLRVRKPRKLVSGDVLGFGPYRFAYDGADGVSIGLTPVIVPAGRS